MGKGFLSGQTFLKSVKPVLCCCKAWSATSSLFAIPLAVCHAMALLTEVVTHRVDGRGARCRKEAAQEHTERCCELLFRECALLPGPTLSGISSALCCQGANSLCYAAAPRHLPLQRLHQVGSAPQSHSGCHEGQLQQEAGRQSHQCLAAALCQSRRAEYAWCVCAGASKTQLCT